ncbi:MAG: tetratricopeptide repeat protein [Sandaracinaceae bacterium]
MPVAPPEPDLRPPHRGGEPASLEPGPRFALRFEAGRGRLSLAKRHRFAFGFVEALELDLGRLQFPLDLSRGPGRFRTRRTRVVSAEVRLDLAALVREWAAEPYGVSLLAPRADGVLVAVRDAFGTVATEVTFGVEGPDVALTLGDARAATEGPAPPLARALVAARSLGLGLDAERGCMLVPRALSSVLREALTPFGWRVPDDRGTSLQLEMLSADRVVLRTGEASVLSDAFAVASRLAPLVGALADGDHERAAQVFVDLEERGVLDAPSRAAAAGLGFGEDPPGGLAGAASRLREALASGEGSRAAREAIELAASEPCDAVAVEGLSSAAELFVEDAPDRATALLERAATRNPTDARVALRLAEVLARMGRGDELARIARAAVNAREPGRERGIVARAAAVICELSGHDVLAGELFETAAAALPDDARAQEGLAEALAVDGNVERAAAQFDRAARLYAANADDAAAAGAWIRGADLAESKGLLAAAEERLSRATALRPTPAAHARLARVRRALGSEPAAERAENALLSSTQGLDPTADASAAVEGLLSASEHALASEDIARARAFYDAAHRLAPERTVPLSARFDALDVERWLSRPAELLALDPPRALSVLRQTPDLDALLTACFEADPPDRIERLAAWLIFAEQEDASEVADRLATHLMIRRAEVADPQALLHLEARADTAEDAASLALAASARFAKTGHPADAARARGRAGAHRRDTAMLRAALTAAERAGAVDAALEIVALALSVVGQGPARTALEAVRARLMTRPD